MTGEIDIAKYISGFDFNVKKVSDSLKNNPELIEKFVSHITAETKDAWRASWVLAHYTGKYSYDLNKYSDEIVNAAKIIKVDGHLRETLKIIINLDLNEEQTSEIFDLCFSILEDNRRQPSVRSIAFQYLMKVAENYPELENEILIIFENIKDYLSNGIRHSMSLRLKSKFKK